MNRSASALIGVASAVIAFGVIYVIVLIVADLLSGCSVDCTMRTNRAKEQACLDAGSIAAFEECIRR